MRAVIVGQNFSMGGVMVNSSYDREEKSGHLNLTVEPDASLAQRKSVALLIRQFADELEGE